MNQRLFERFISYTRIHTTSNPDSPDSPSSQRQFDLAHLLVEELRAAGCTDAAVDRKGYVTATVLANAPGAPVIGLIAHLDTSPDFNGENVSPRLIQNYNGETIVLNQDNGWCLDPAEFPELLHYRGQDLIVTDGNSLLGADDKAGIAEIMEAVDYLNQHPDIPHGEVKICFTPDEEIGRGADHFDVKAFAADFAYTLDGGPIGELEYENFNAASARVLFQGLNIHPGTAKGKMINAMQVAMDFHKALPENERPENTEGYEGFFHLTRMSGTVEEAVIEYIIRDHNRELFDLKKETLRELATRLNLQYKPGTVKVILRDQYFNMRAIIENHYHIVEKAIDAYRRTGIEPVIKPIRGGTDGARLSYMGLPTPNLFTGGHNYHGRYEYIPVQSMEKAVEMIVNLIRIT